ncbi:hypothetical protein GALMADRAFT_243050 [Galerina marginata CBS 339.88]|uniref:Muconate cycloisomerase 1 n=1 Tax=Galerina marginata (strain CBS 339.88) TaxID=685588 RepID=A0A067TGW7_GALM3|nr:hypothetical protein GALMADRAFT_243050 [Galerina marginata CBS 339.88]
MDVQHALHYQQAVSVNNTSGVLEAPLYHILSGSFRSVSLFLLAFSPSSRSLSHLQTVPANGPHQYLAANQLKDRVYTTSWALPPSLSSWHVERSDSWRVTHINFVPITATSSYIAVPPPFTRCYSVGGPTGESHVIDSDTGALGERLQQILFIPEDQLETADKTRVALRYGSHGIEFTPSSRYAFVPVLGTDSIEMYSHELSSGQLSHISSVGSPRGKNAKDGPRHVKIHPNGKVLYCVTEHTNFVDAYRILPTTLEHIGSRSMLPQELRNSSESSSPLNSRDHFRGDTLMLPPSTSSKPSPELLITTTRGSTSNVRGWLSVFPLDEDGNFARVPPGDSGHEDIEAERFQTPTSGGKANAIDIRPKSMGGDDTDGLWILLTDDDEDTASPSGGGAIRVLEWDGWGKGGLRVVSEWPTSTTDPTSEGHEDEIRGASHAIWLD